MTWVETVFKFNTLRRKSTVLASIHICKGQQFFNVLFFWRVLSLLLTIATCTANIVHQLHTHDAHWEFFLSFTNLSFIFMALYFMAAAIMSFNDWKKKRYAYFVSVPGGNATTESLLFGSSIDDDDPQLDQPPRTNHIIFWISFEVAFTVAIFVDIVFWGTLHSTSDVLEVLLHALNGGFMVGELFFNSLVFVPSHVIFVWFLLFAYTIEVVVWHSVDNEWAYTFLDPSNKIAWAYYPVLFIAATVSFTIGYLFVLLRDRRKAKPRNTPSIQEADILF